jgi:hypothetical protein
MESELPRRQGLFQSRATSAPTQQVLWKGNFRFAFPGIRLIFWTVFTQMETSPTVPRNNELRRRFEYRAICPSLDSAQLVLGATRFAPSFGGHLVKGNNMKRELVGKGRGWKKGQRLKAKGQNKSEELVRRVDWVRRVQIGQRTVGVGFVENKLSYVDANPPRAPKAWQISLDQSIVILRGLLKFELTPGTGVDMDESGWGKWLGRIGQRLKAK